MGGVCLCVRGVFMCDGCFMCEVVCLCVRGVFKCLGCVYVLLVCLGVRGCVSKMECVLCCEWQCVFLCREKENQLHFWLALKTLGRMIKYLVWSW